MDLSNNDSMTPLVGCGARVDGVLMVETAADSVELDDLETHGVRKERRVEEERGSKVQVSWMVGLSLRL